MAGDRRYWLVAGDSTVNREYINSRSASPTRLIETLKLLMLVSLA